MRIIKPAAEMRFGVGDLLGHLIGFGRERCDRIHVGTHLSPASEQSGIVV